MSQGKRKGYFEAPDIRTGKAPKHQRTAFEYEEQDISNAEVKPTPVALFSYENVEDAKVQLEEGLDFPYVGVQSSTLAGKENVSILITVSKDPESEWPNHILQNSCYGKIHILRDGTVEQFCGWRLKLRKFKGKSIEHVIEKINKIKLVE